MKLLYVSEHRFICGNDGKLYTTGTLTRNYFSRFDGIFEKVIVVGTAERICDQNKDKIVQQITLDSPDSLTIDWQLSQVDCSRFSLLNRTLIAKKKAKQYIGLCDAVTMKAPSRSSVFVGKLAKQNCKPFLIEVVGCPWDAYWNHGLRGKIVAPAITLVTKKAVNNAPFAIYVTNEFLQSRYPCAGKSIGLSDVTLEEFDSSVLKRRIEKIKGDKSKIVIGTAAAVNVRYKGQQHVMAALASLKRQGNSNFEYQLVGGGDQSYLLSQAKKYGVEEQVVFRGVLPHEEIFSWLDTIDIYVQPSSQEGLPRAVVEAMSRGLPCIGTDVGGIPELIESNYIISTSNNISQQIADKILSFQDKDLMALSAKASYTKALEYRHDILKKKRYAFFLEFVKETQQI